MPAFLVVCGPCNLDILLRVQDLPKDGQSTPVLDRRVVRGGNGGNIAIHAAGLDVPVRLWSRVGADFPTTWRDDLQRRGVDDCLVIDGPTTPTCFVFTDAFDRQCFAIDLGPRRDETEGPREDLISNIAAGGWLHLCTGDPLLYAAVASAAHAAGIHVALDPGQELSFRYDATALQGMLGLCDALFVNEAELAVAASLLGLTMPEDLLRFVPLVVVTRGAKGASLYRRNAAIVHAAAFSVDHLADPTGAGDAFRAGWYAALQQGLGTEMALRWGQAAGAAKVRHAGAQEHVLSRADLTRFLA